MNVSQRMKQRNPELNVGYILLISLVAAFGGFLFGYDTAVVSGAIGFLKAHFQLSADLTGWAASSLLVGCMAGAMLGGPLGDRFGRKSSLIFCAVLFAISSLVSAIPDTLAQFAWARFAGGIAIGAASMLSPLYIAEIAPEKIRGTLVALYQLAIVGGILIVFFVNLQIQRIGDETWNTHTGWRWMFASLTIPSVLFGFLMMLVPESPRWLMKMGRAGQARKILERVGGPANAEREIQQIAAALKQEEGRWSELFTSGYFRALIIGILLAVFGQFSGINAIMYFAPEILKSGGAGLDSAFRQTVIIGVFNVLFTFVAIWLVDKAGRKPLLIAGTLVQAVSLVSVGWMFHTGNHGPIAPGEHPGVCRRVCRRHGADPLDCELRNLPHQTARTRDVAGHLHALAGRFYRHPNLPPPARVLRARPHLLDLRLFQPLEHRICRHHGARNQRPDPRGNRSQLAQTLKSRH